MAATPDLQQKDPRIDAYAPRPRFRITLGVCGFVLSVTLALINAFYAIRGSAVVVQPLQQMVLYRDGDGDGAILGIAGQITMFNVADSAHGDVLMEASLSPAKGVPAFRYATAIRSLFTGASGRQRVCPADTRCVTLPGLTIIETADENLSSIPGGSLRVANLSFPLTVGNCQGQAAACAKVVGFNRALSTLAAHPLFFEIELQFYADGKRRLNCSTNVINVAYLKAYGWSTIACRSSAVTGAPLL